jgi:hypothetical protein
MSAELQHRARSLWPARYASNRVNEHLLRARIGQMKRRGEIDPHEIFYREEGEQIAAYVLRTRPPAKRMPRVMAWCVLVGSTFYGIGWLLWESRYVLLALAVTLLVLVLIRVSLSVLGQQSAGCSCVIHGPGCRG